MNLSSSAGLIVRGLVERLVAVSVLILVLWFCGQRDQLLIRQKTSSTEKSWRASVALPILLRDCFVVRQGGIWEHKLVHDHSVAGNLQVVCYSSP